ncbi:MAG: hypothetical protein ABJA64_00045, partial [Candidatus Saccharibacteria bacterium]
EWPINRPAVLRSQLIQFGSSFMTSDFDTKLDGASSPNALTKFLYPAVAGSTTASFLPNDSSPSPVKCNVNNSPYTCSITLDLPNPINGDSTNRTAFLRLSALYNLADYKVVLLNDTNVVKFAGVQAKVDSTGRAGDLFRRVVARVNLQLNDGFPYPEASIDLNGNLCKTFQVTDNAADYNAGGCQP